MFDLLESPALEAANIEFTSRCNLQCTYCASKHPNYQGKDLNPESIDDIFTNLIERNIKSITVNGHGETTILKDWPIFCQKFLASGAALAITTNMAKPFSKEEVKLLARFTIIDASCDTSDPKLFQELRSGADLKTLVLNIVKIQEEARKKKLKGPEFMISCVVGDKNVFFLENLVRFALKLKIKNFHFINLIKQNYPNQEPQKQLNHILELPEEKLKKIPRIFEKILKIIKRKKGKIIESASLLEIIDKIEKKTRKKNQANRIIQKTNIEATTRFTTLNEPNNTVIMTRDCLDPWNYVYILADSSVKHCCVALEPIGNLNNGQKLSSILNSDKIKKIRQGLLSGNLENDCLLCTQKTWIEIEKLKEKVEKYFINYFENNQNVFWGNGFYSLESKIQDGKIIVWRWCKETGYFQINNETKKDIKLEFKGEFGTGWENSSNLLIETENFSESLKVNNKGMPFEKILKIHPGRNIIKFYCDAQKVKPPQNSNDFRKLVFYIRNYSLKTIRDFL